jgi:signal transduction histidine kinase
VTVRRTRVGINIRVFTLAATIGLAGANQLLPGALGGYLVLCGIAAIASLPHSQQGVNRAVPVVEGVLVGLALGVAGGVNQSLGMYLLAPALLAGLVGGPIIVSATFLAELCATVTVPIVRLQPQLVAESVRSMLPWLLTAIGIGLLGSWIRRLGGPAVDDDHERYQAAYLLLDQLRVVSRRLSSGLDPVVLSTTLLDDCLEGCPDGRGSVLIRTEGGVFTSLSQRDRGGSADSPMNYPMVVECWRSGAATPGTGSDPASASSTSDDASLDSATGSSATRVQWALPLRVGERMVAVLALDLSEPLALERREQIQSLLGERALPLDTGLLFEEVRALATVEERRRVAREIHDGIAQEIVSLGYLVDEVASAPDEDARRAGVSRVRRELTRIVDDLRLSIFDLRSPVSRSAGLGPVLGEYLQMVGARSGAAVHLTLDEGPDRLPLHVEEQLLRITQEAVTNARKHSGAANFWVKCHVRSPAADIIIEDDGTGLGQLVRTDSFGLSVMRERADGIGATLSVNERVGGGTRIMVSLPPAGATPLATAGGPQSRRRRSPALISSVTRASA